MNDDLDTVNFVIMRHAESEWNVEDRFTGWQDVPLAGRVSTSI
jgi:bisphosphoglycerate-dependent phosphoglycerate mutase